MTSDLGKYVWFYYDQIIGSLDAIVVTKSVQHSIVYEGMMAFLIQWYN